MKCIIMKILEILYFFVNIIIINSSVVIQDKLTSSKTETGAETLEEGFGQDCYHLLEKINDNGFSDFMIKCPEIKKEVNNSEDVLQHICFVVREMLKVVCKEKLNETSLNLFERESTNNICPFHFTHLERTDVFKNHEIVKHLAVNDICEKVCYQVFTTQVLCILLYKFNNYLKSQILVTHEKEVKLPLKETLITDIGIQKTSKSQVRQPSQPIQLNQPLPLQNTNDEGNMKTSVQLETEKNLPEPVQSKAKDSPMNAKEETSDSYLAEPVKNPLTKEKKTDKPVSKVTLKEPQITEDPDILKSDVKEKDMEKYKTNSNIENKPLDEDLSNEDANLPEINDSPLGKSDFNQEMDVQEAISSPKDIPFVKEKEVFIRERFSEPEDSHFFFYFITVSSIVVVGYLAFHNKNKILAYALEGSSGRRSRRRPNPARYRKLESNLEEAMTSGATNTATSTVVY